MVLLHLCHRKSLCTILHSIALLYVFDIHQFRTMMVEQNKKGPVNTESDLPDRGQEKSVTCHLSSLLPYWTPSSSLPHIASPTPSKHKIQNTPILLLAKGALMENEPRRCGSWDEPMGRSPKKFFGIPGLNSNSDPRILENLIPGFYGIYHF